MSRDNNDTHWHITIDSLIGPLGLVATDQGLRAVIWRGEETSVKLPADMLDGSDHPVLAQAAEQLTEYFRGDRTPLRPAPRSARHRVPGSRVAGPR